MKVVVFGATGMVGQGVLIECLEDPAVTKVVAVVRRATGRTHPKLEEVVHADFSNYAAIENKLAGLDACFFCLGISSVGMSEADYTKVTYDYALAAAETLKRVSPNITMCFVSGAGTDSSEKGSSMWARVKGKTENALLAMFPGKAFMFRPGFIQPMKGVVSKTALYRSFYAVLGFLTPVIKALAPNVSTTTVTIGRAMIHAVQKPPAKTILESPDINALAA